MTVSNPDVIEPIMPLTLAEQMTVMDLKFGRSPQFAGILRLLHASGQLSEVLEAAGVHAVNELEQHA